jgi:hypothetical protein
MVHCPDKDKISRHKLEGGDHADLLALVDRMRERAARALEAAPSVVSCYEAVDTGSIPHSRPTPKASDLIDRAWCRFIRSLASHSPSNNAVGSPRRALRCLVCRG